MFNFEPFDPTDEKALFGLYDDGDYDFVVKDMVPYTNQKNGKQSLKTSILVFGNDGLAKMIDVYLTPAFKKLFVHFFRSIGMEDECRSGKINPESIIDKSGRCTLGSEFPEAGSKYDPKNIIVDFLRPTTQQIDPNFNDDVAF